MLLYVHIKKIYKKIIIHIGIILILFLLVFYGAKFTGYIISEYLHLKYHIFPYVIRSLDDYSPSLITKVYDNMDNLIGEFYLEKREVLAAEAIPDIWKKVVVAKEDHRFYEHSGVDFKGLFRATIINIKTGGFSEGASTLTQQLARNYVLNDRNKTLYRKIKEIILSFFIETHYSKEDILAFYLNQIYFGKGAYGIEAASKKYFGKNAENCNLAEITYLVGLIPRPNAYNRNIKIGKKHQEIVLDVIQNRGVVTDQDIIIAKNYPLVFKEAKRERMTYFLEYIRQKIRRQYGRQILYSGGLHIYTTLDSRLQKLAEKALKKNLNRINKLRYSKKKELSFKNKVQGAIISIDPYSGEIKAMVGGSDFEETELNRCVQIHRPIGSLFKPFVYTQALRNGWKLSDKILDAPIYIPKINNGEDWIPQNFGNKFSGYTALREALMHSKNVPTIKLFQQIDKIQLKKLLHKLGIKFNIPNNESLAIGTLELAPIQVAKMFSIFVNNGYLNSAFSIRYIKDKYGTEFGVHSPSRTKIIKPEIAFLIRTVLEDVVNRGTGRRVRWMYGGFKGDVAGKTGTTNMSREAWFCGFNPELVTCVYTGYDDRRPMGSKFTGAYTSIPAFTDYYMNIYNDSPPAFDEPPAGVVQLTYTSDTSILEWYTTDNVPEQLEDTSKYNPNIFLPELHILPDNLLDKYIFRKLKTTDYTDYAN